MRTIASQIPHVMVLPDFTADCSMFADTVHLNRKGGEQFTEYLRTRVALTPFRSGFFCSRCGPDI